MSDARRREVDAIVEGARRFAQGRHDLAALALVGSWARSAGREDSDVDLVLLTDAPAGYVERDEWIAELAPGGRLVRTAVWGPLVERRLVLPSSLELDVGIATPAWAATDPVDPGTSRVVREGLRPLFDPLELLARLAAAC